MLLAVALAVGWGLFQNGESGDDPESGVSGTTSATIERVVDGDTLIVRAGGARQRVRVLGIDTPETVKPGTPVQRCGPEATVRAKAWAGEHRSVRLRRDPAAPDADRYERRLRYVLPSGDGPDLSTVLVRDGLARVNAYGQDLRELSSLHRAERRAKREGRGLWATGGCGR